MKKVLGLVFLGISLLSGCSGDDGELAGVYESIKENSITGNVNTTQIKLTKEEGGYNIHISSKSGNQSKFSKGFDWGTGVKDGKYIVRLRDNKKVFEVISLTEFKRIDIPENPIFKKVE